MFFVFIAEEVLLLGYNFFPISVERKLSNFMGFGGCNLGEFFFAIWIEYFAIKNNIYIKNSRLLFNSYYTNKFYLKELKRFMGTYCNVYIEVLE